MQTQDAFDKRFPDENACREYLKKMRWPDGVKCPRCGHDKVYELKARPFNWVCKSGKESVNKSTGEVLTCNKKNGYRFSVITHTVFENTKRPLVSWFKIGYLMLVSKKGISALQLHRMMFGSKHLDNYHTTWCQCMRLRGAMRDSEWEQLMGEVEIDEVYLGGKEKNKHKGKRVGNWASQGKTEVIGAIARKGNIVCQMVEEADFSTYDNFVRKTVSGRVNLIATDETFRYRHLRSLGFPHEIVTHKREEYVRGKVHTQNIESFWSLLRRGVMGTYHKMSRDYLPLYLSEFTFRHNRRHDDDPFAELISNA
ncbi:MAG: IS1595 family transposase [Candidatus Binatus sp.]|uniref:IS1595 family transposase n=1 Tax=Candidatus Binatus sp. TaxID=2811406 RepID=UPI00271BEA67|nr:IS1595 family transposase [Candidatus Binatus sp.]MDO8431403.1 IS1595 family transposase [Candidatus Binatus sp.]